MLGWLRCRRRVPRLLRRGRRVLPPRTQPRTVGVQLWRSGLRLQLLRRCPREIATTATRATPDAVSAVADAVTVVAVAVVPCASSPQRRRAMLGVLRRRRRVP